MNADLTVNVKEDRTFKVNVDTGTVESTRLNLFESWLTLWCLRNCKETWRLVRDDNALGHQLVLNFSNHREAVHFRLASGSLHVTSQMDDTILH
jgi:hypothetical protein